jgi:phosphoglucomutase
MSTHPLAGQPAPPSARIDIPHLVSSYFLTAPDPAEPSQRLAFGTSGHRGCAWQGSFNEAHILAVTQAICEYRRRNGISGPLFLGCDTHALSTPSSMTALEVLAANGVETMVAENGGYTPTPVISHAILTHNRGRQSGWSDGIVITPSHNPPPDGGFKYNPPHGGPADPAVTRWVEERANGLLSAGNGEVRRVPYARALRAATTHARDFIRPYVEDLKQAIDLEAIRAAGLKIGVDPLGGASVAYWSAIAEIHGLDLQVVNATVDPTFGFMTLDRDGVIRMDCSSPYAMARLIDLKDRFTLAFGNDPDADRHGVVTPTHGLLNPNHYLAAAVWYLFRHRPDWPPQSAVGKTLVSSSMLDRVARELNRPLYEVPVGFKWFVEGLRSGQLGFGGEESAGASFLRRDGSVWSTDKDGILLNLLAAEMTAVSGRNPGELYDELTAKFGAPVYERLDVPADAEAKRVLAALAPAQVDQRELAGDPIVAVLTRAPGNDAPIGGLKVVSSGGWFAARPSGTENIYKIYAESFRGLDHLRRIQSDAQELVQRALRQARGAVV